MNIYISLWYLRGDIHRPAVAMYKNMLKNAQKFESDRFCDFIGFIRYDCFRIRGIFFEKKKYQDFMHFCCHRGILILIYIPGGLAYIP